MPPFYELAVASFKQPSSSKLRWTIAVIVTPSSGHSLVYQVVGSSSDYSLEVPQSVTLKEGEDGHVGKVRVGTVDSEKVYQLHSTLVKVPIKRGDPAWSSHNWVMDGLSELRKVEGYLIDKHVTSKWVSERLGEK